jgi:hypothetical protein
VAYNLQTGSDNTKLLTEYERVLRKYFIFRVNIAECQTTLTCALFMARKGKAIPVTERAGL